MGGVSTPGGDGGLNVELNLVPFIDLLSSLVLFLLLSAVWVQVAGIQASVGSKKGPTALKNDTPPKNLGVHINAKGFQLTWPAGKSYAKTIAKKGDQYDWDGLKGTVMGAMKAKAVEAGSVSSDDTIPYGMLITAIDVIRDSGLAGVALSTE